MIGAAIGVYAAGSFLTWCVVYTSLSGRRLRRWAIASGTALIWPPFLWQLRRWNKRQSWVDDLERELHQVGQP